MRAAESLVNKPNSPVDSTTPIPPKSPGGPKDLKTTTIVMSKHTLAPQTPPVSFNIIHLHLALVINHNYKHDLPCMTHTTENSTIPYIMVKVSVEP